MKILGYEYIVRENIKRDQLNASGRANMDTQEFLIASNICEEQKISTCLHEIIEALNFHLEMQLTHQNICCLESGFYQVFKDKGIDLSKLLK